MADGAGVMCPSYRATRDEKDSTRGRARVLQELANGSAVRGWRAPEVAESLDLCLSCKACSSECPTGVDMATYKAEVLYQRYRHRPRPPAHYSLGWLPRWARLASLAPQAVNRLAAGRLAPLGKRLAGVDERRALPAFASRTFRRWFADHPVATGIRCCCGWTPSPTTSPRRSASPRSRCWKRPAIRCGSPTGGCAAG
ncbi:hypothetical protein C1Y40_05206 [Mycobacterium talmoniae]|uniref:4Fe-4S ferredoxin-type domain-containing protein n=1 Tax=Mycobacterium talmoniae TaxID=1858794 RepID=A0A2S8BD90_9MYCO|nr:hypothetical protein C1Y40_05206 [Mycobacterium talmoniae]